MNPNAPPPARVEKSANTVWQQATSTRTDRAQLNQHASLLLWFTGFSSSGKSTLAQTVARILHDKAYRTYVLDGDNIRHGLCSDLGFSNEDRKENIRRIGEVAAMMVDAGLIVIVAFISPFRADRQRVRNLVAPGDFIEIFCDCAIDLCEKRDVKGLYKRARNGEIRDFTGISSPYEAPINPELRLRTGEEGVEACAQKVVETVVKRCAMGKLS